MKLSRAFIAIVAALLGAFALLGTAQAAESRATPPACSPGTTCLPGTDTAGNNGYCPFPVTITYTGGQKPGPNGLFTGHGTATVTNTTNGKTLTYNISGPGKLTFYPNGSISSADAGGPNLLYTTVANSYPGVPQLAYSTGRVQFTVNPDGVTTSYSLQGKRTDVCAALA